MSSNSLSDEIGRLLLCLSQSLFKSEDDPDINFVRLGLGEYIMELHQAEHLIPEKRIHLMSEVLYCTDRDHLSKNQFFEAVLGIKSSDEVRHWLYKVHSYLRNLAKGVTNPIQSHTTETKSFKAPNTLKNNADERARTYENFLDTSLPPPTFEEQYPKMQNKRIKLNRKEWNFESFLHKIMNNFYEYHNNMEILDIAKDGTDIIYQTDERPNEERSLVQDLKTILFENDVSDIPVGTLLLLLERILNVFDYEDKQTMPKPVIDNIIDLTQDYPKFNDHIIYE